MCEWELKPTLSKRDEDQVGRGGHHWATTQWTKILDFRLYLTTSFDPLYVRIWKFSWNIVILWIIFPNELELPQFDIWVESYGLNTKKYTSWNPSMNWTADLIPYSIWTPIEFG